MYFGMEVRWRLSILLMELGLDPMPIDSAITNADELLAELKEKIENRAREKSKLVEEAKKAINASATN